MMDSTNKKNKRKLYAQVWNEWVKTAQTNPEAQQKINAVIKHPEFELYNLKSDPWEGNDLASNPEYAELLKSMHADLKSEMALLKDSFKPEFSLKEKHLTKGTKKKKKK